MNKGGIKEQFEARFYRTLDGRDYETWFIYVNYEQLKEIGTKPPNVFRYKDCSYFYDKKCIKSFNSKGLPILKYHFGETLPIMEAQLNRTVVKDPEKPTKEELPFMVITDEAGNSYSVIDAHDFDATFHRGEMKNIIVASQKEPQKWDWLTLVIGAFLGAGVGIVVGIILYPHLFASGSGTVNTGSAVHTTTALIRTIAGVFL